MSEMVPLRRRRILGLGLLAASAPLVVRASPQAADPETPLPGWWPSLARYREENAKLIAAGAKVDCVFMGDSITERWPMTRPAFFPAGRICRGISGQTTPQMLVRFRADVVALKPAVVHLMGGTNDIAGNTGYASPEMIAANLMSMTEIALANGLGIILASILPAARYPWRPGVDPVAPTRALNEWLKTYAAAVGAVYADYYAVLADAKGGMRPGFAIGDVHPTKLGYEAMEPVALEAIATAHAMGRRGPCPIAR